MASRACPRAIEILFPRVDVAGLKIADRHPAPATRLRHNFLSLCMKESGEVINLAGRKFECRHAAFGTAIAHNDANFVAGHVTRDQVRTHEVRSGFTATGVTPVTKSAILSEKGFSVLHDRS